MNKRTGIIVYLFLLLADLLVIYSGKETLRYFTKPLLMPLLACLFILMTKDIASDLSKWIVLALLFSWAGDVLLMFEQVNGNFFIFGLISFLTAHIFYILFFKKIQYRERLKGRWLFYITVPLYYFALMYMLDPHLEEMRWPVRVYGFVISTMLLLALHSLFIQNKKAGRLLVSGALLFIVSDSVLAVNKFYQPFAGAGVLIMITYGLAQLYIVTGAVCYIQSSKSA